MRRLTVLKIGGNIINDETALGRSLDYLARTAGAGVLIHGGGRRASTVMRAMNLEPQLIDGRRVTDARTLDIVTMVYAGLLNKQIVAQLQARGVNAIGLSGADGNAVRAHRRSPEPVDFGWVGDIDAVNGPLLAKLIDAGLHPVLCAISHDGRGQLLNTNADTIANEVARSTSRVGFEVSLQYCFELPGVLTDVNDPNSVIPTITPEVFPELRDTGVIAGGMIPKLENAIAAVESGVAEVVIGNLAALEEERGTRVTSTKFPI